jgi:hypothetical protein
LKDTDHWSQKGVLYTFTVLRPIEPIRRKKEKYNIRRPVPGELNTSIESIRKVELTENQFAEKGKSEEKLAREEIRETESLEESVKPKSIVGQTKRIRLPNQVFGWILKARRPLPILDEVSITYLLREQNCNIRKKGAVVIGLKCVRKA